MISVDDVQKPSIRAHYQLGSLFYWLLWGSHIHHGLWHADESVSQAQRQLIDELANMAGFNGGQRIVDIGCGMGGSSIHLARHRGCHVTGVTLSPMQRHWAATSARVQRLSERTRFIAADAEEVSFEPASFDGLWSIECTEHLFDKQVFFRRAIPWLKPGGRIALAVWFEGEDTARNGHRRQCEEVCRRFICPSLGSRDDYVNWLQELGLTIEHNVNWTAQVERTWEICKGRVKRTGIRHVAKWIDREQMDFIDGFDTLLKAYQSGAMQYGAIVARKPDAPN